MKVVQLLMPRLVDLLLQVLWRYNHLHRLLLLYNQLQLNWWHLQLFVRLTMSRYNLVFRHKQTQLMIHCFHRNMKRQCILEQ